VWFGFLSIGKQNERLGGTINGWQEIDLADCRGVGIAILGFLFLDNYNTGMNVAANAMRGTVWGIPVSLHSTVGYFFYFLRRSSFESEIKSRPSAHAWSVRCAALSVPMPCQMGTSERRYVFSVHT
jgi:hypothetical protein